MRTPIYDDMGYFQGFEQRECGDHRTVGAHRAWCHDCTEWCYPDYPCVRCEIGAIRQSGRYARTRNNDHATSIQGAVQVGGRAATQRIRLLHAYGDAEPLGFPSAFDGLTDEEAAQACGLLNSCYWKRCGELRADGLIEFTGGTRPGAAGTARKVSRITERGRAVLRTEAEAS